MKKNLCLLMIAMSLCLLCYAQPSSDEMTDLARANQFQKMTQAAFEENKGQVWDMDDHPASYVQYHFNKGNMNIFMLSTGIAYQFNQIHYPEGYQHDQKELKAEEREVQEALQEQIRLETYRMDMELVGANPNAAIIAEGKSEDYVNYYNRNTLDVHSFERLGSLHN